MKLLDTKLTKHGSPLYYIYDKNDDYPPVIKNKIPTEDETSYAVKFFSNKKYVEVIKNKDFKIADIIYFPQGNTYGVSKKFKEIFQYNLRVKFFNTNLDNYFLMIVDNIVDCVDFKKSHIIYYDNNRRCTYKRSESKIILNNTLVPKNELLFSIPEEPLVTLCSDKFVDMCEQYKIKNVVFKDF